MDAATPMWSRSSTCAVYVAVGSIDIVISTTPREAVRAISNPDPAATWSIDAFVGRISKTKRSIPSPEARRASCSSMRVAMPTPCSASATANATSAARGSRRRA